MGNVLLFASGKGGVGKSTVVAGLGSALASDGKKVLLVDCDVCLGALDMMLFCAEKNVYNWLDVCRGSVDAAQASIVCRRGLRLLTAPRSEVLASDGGSFASLISSQRQLNDYILIDAPAGIGEMIGLTAPLSDYAILVATPDEVSVKAAAVTEARCEELGVKTSRLIINRFRYKAVKQRRLLTVDSVVDKSFTRLLGIVPEDDAVVYSSVTKKELSPKSSVYRAFGRIAQRIEGRECGLLLSDLK